MVRSLSRALIALAAMPLLASGATAQIAVVANDGKAILNDGVNSVPANPVTDYVAVIDLKAVPPKIVAEILAPASVVGPPQSVAISADESLALVTSAMKLDPANDKRLIPDNRLTMIDLKATPPTVTATLETGSGPAGVSINRAGTLALVANRSEGTVSVFTISGKTATPAGKVSLGDAKSGPSHVVFAPDGKSALVSRDGDHKISVLSIDGSKVEHAKRDLNAGLRPYSLEMSPAGDVAVVGNIGLSGGDDDTISLIDMKAKPPRVVDTVSVGQTPEGVGISPDGKFVAVNVVNGSNKPKASPFFNDFGLLKIYGIRGNKLVPVAEAKTGHWCQGVAWSKGNRMVVVGCMVEKELQAFTFNGKALKAAGVVKFGAGPAGLRASQ